MIEGMRGTMLSSASVGTNFIDPRLRQLVWPTGDEAAPWVALTPLQSSGLSEMIRARVRAESETGVNRSNAIFGIGGSNPQNVGRYVRSMQRPLVFNGPKENKDIRQAYALHFKGADKTYMTGIQVGRVPGVGVVFSGFGLMFVGMYMAFFMSHRRYWARLTRKPDGNFRATVAGAARRHQYVFEEEFEALIKGLAEVPGVSHAKKLTRTEG